MTHLEKFVALYAELGIECKVNRRDDSTQYITLAYEPEGEPDATASDKFDGYYSFYTRIEFDANGNFVKQGFWE